MLEKLDSCQGVLPIYSDTDSVYYQLNKGYDHKKYSETVLPLCSNELGGWDIEKSNCEGVFIGPKLYALKD